MYSIEDIKNLITILEDSQLAVMEISDGKGSSIRLEKPASPVVNNYNLSSGTAVQTAQPDGENMTAQTRNTLSSDDANAIKSPMVGVFYAASSPESKPYVSVGQKVSKGDVLCIIEAMKLMNEITAEQSGTIAEVCVNNGDIVEYGQTLFKIK